jgi:hypothetical protein
MSYCAWHEFYRRGVEREPLDRVGPLERLHLHPSEVAGVVRVVLERRVSTTMGSDGVTHELWAVLTAFHVASETIPNSAELWKQAWIYTGKREYGEKAPEA